PIRLPNPQPIRPQNPPPIRLPAFGIPFDPIPPFELLPPYWQVHIINQQQTIHQLTQRNAEQGQHILQLLHMIHQQGNRLQQQEQQNQVLQQQRAQPVC